MNKQEAQDLEKIFMGYDISFNLRMSNIDKLQKILTIATEYVRSHTDKIKVSSEGAKLNRILVQCRSILSEDDLILLNNEISSQLFNKKFME